MNEELGPEWQVQYNERAPELITDTYSGGVVDVEFAYI